MVQLLGKKEERSKETEERRIREERSCSLELFGLMAHTVPWLLGSRRIREETKQKEIRNRRWNKSGTAGNLEDGLSYWRKEQFEHDEPSFFYDPVLSTSQKRNIFILSWYRETSSSIISSFLKHSTISLTTHPKVEVTGKPLNLKLSLIETQTCFELRMDS